MLGAARFHRAFIAPMGNSRMSKSPLRRLRSIVLGTALAIFAAQPVMAQSVLRDSETEALFREISTPLVKGANLDPKSFNIVLINDPEINAFVAQGQTVYIQSGLLVAADNVNQVQGVIAHELGHVAGGHAIRIYDGAAVASKISIVSLLLGVAAIAAGAGEAGMGVMAAGQQAAQGTFNSFSRAQESSADLAGANYLGKAGVTGKGSLEFFKKLQNQEYRLAVYATDSYNRTHPLSSERVATLTNLYQKDPAWTRPTDPAIEARFQRVRAKLIGFVSDKEAVIRTYPPSNTSVPARYARAYAYHRMGDRDAALKEADALLTDAPQDPFYLELKGQILLESGRPAEALEPLREAVRKAPDQPMIQAMLGHALLATEKNDNLPEAERVLRASIGRDNEQPFAWYQLGMIYSAKGDLPRAALATAERYNLQGEAKLALVSAERALQGIPQGTPDFLRAQDIAMVSRAVVAKDRKGKGRREQ